MHRAYGTFHIFWLYATLKHGVIKYTELTALKLKLKKGVASVYFVVTDFNPLK